MYYSIVSTCCYLLKNLYIVMAYSGRPPANVCEHQHTPDILQQLHCYSKDVAACHMQAIVINNPPTAPATFDEHLL
jgi:hypothetical protein